MTYDCQDLIRLFAATFAARYNTELVAGGVEPEYVPAGTGAPRSRIVFAHDYYRSALHEVAHWCVAGAQRRLLADFGYWYAPDGRTAGQQAQFEQVEVKPQALEWMFCEAAGHPFRISLDNLSGEHTDAAPFKERVAQQVQAYLSEGVAERPAAFIQALLDFYRPGHQLAPKTFTADRI
ncbi:MAG TPA: elongation factor P hydroxylase [Pseudomonas xinjiangensis]|uniref:Elongation factor P hydroxylase n=2 Tax=root TaxID=1 RepID=A0A7V1BQ70_9GAMM|nr:elongation factor P hydroxylase [Halopseudomonas xinjiangensis]HEC48771.1 elongation factor P hydroxylase [Halopseudomonas xinjiangensis]